MSNPNIGTVERAFQLAKSGEFQTLAEIRHKLVHEHYSNIDAHLSGSAIRRQLMALIAAHRGPLGEPNADVAEA